MGVKARTTMVVGTMGSSFQLELPERFPRSGVRGRLVCGALEEGYLPRFKDKLLLWLTKTDSSYPGQPSSKFSTTTGPSSGALNLP